MKIERTEPASPWAIDEILTPWQIVFGLRGRIPRKTWWAYGLVGLSLFNLDAYMLLNLAGMHPRSAQTVVNLLLVWPTVALLVKRWHDRDKSAWWLLLNLIPGLGVAWTLIECCLLRGTAGPNRFGDDPTGLV